jgi:Transglycosylase SLT domain
MAAMTLAVVMGLAGTPACSVDGMVPSFWPRVVTQESGYDPLALHDDTTSTPYHPATIDEAETIARRLMAVGHSVGVGLSQLTARSEGAFFATFHITVRQALDACPNMHAGAQHYVSRALSIYNSGDPERSLAYAASVQRIRLDQTTAAPPPEAPADDPKDPRPPAWNADATYDWNLRHHVPEFADPGPVHRRTAPVVIQPLQQGKVGQ